MLSTVAVINIDGVDQLSSTTFYTYTSAVGKNIQQRLAGIGYTLFVRKASTPTKAKKHA